MKYFNENGVMNNDSDLRELIDEIESMLNSFYCEHQEIEPMEWRMVADEIATSVNLSIKQSILITTIRKKKRGNKHGD